MGIDGRGMGRLINAGSRASNSSMCRNLFLFTRRFACMLMRLRDACCVERRVENKSLEPKECGRRSTQHNGKKERGERERNLRRACQTTLRTTRRHQRSLRERKRGRNILDVSAWAARGRYCATTDLPPETVARN